VSSSKSARTRISILGGSSAYLPSLALDLSSRKEELPALDIRLFGRNRSRLSGVTCYCQRLALEHEAQHEYGFSLSIDEVMDDADVIINMMRIGGFEGRSHDERFPLRYDLPGDESIGPAGLASAIRSLPFVLQAVRRAERVSPQATWINMSNPMGILVAGLASLTSLRILGLCELPEHTIVQALDLIDAQGKVEVDYVGLNHQGFFLRVEQDGRDLLPAIFHRIGQLQGGGFFRIETRIMEGHNALPLPYMRLYFHQEREVALQSTRKVDRGRELEEHSRLLHAAYATPAASEAPSLLSQRSMPWNELTLVPALIALTGDRQVELYVSEPNRGYIPFLPDNAIVEKRALLGRDAIRPFPLVADGMDKRHKQVRDLLCRIQDFESQASKAALSPSEENVLMALATHPFQISDEDAHDMLPDLLQDSLQDLVREPGS
jgi:6-phospho-beta-glucosidase